MDKSQEAVSTFVITGSYAAKLLQLQEKGFHQMPFLVKPPIYEPGIGFIALGRDAEISADIGDKLPQFPFPVGFVQHLLCDLYVMHVPSRKLNMDGVAKSIHDSMNLGASAAPTDPDALILLGRIFFRLLAIILPLSRHPRLPCVP